MKKKMTKCACGRIIGHRGAYFDLMCDGCIYELRAMGWSLETVAEKHKEQHEGLEITSEVIAKWKE